MLWSRAANKVGSGTGGRGRAGPLHDEMAQGRVGQELANPRNNGRQQHQQGDTRWGGGRTDTTME